MIKNIPPITRYLLIANIVVFVLQHVFPVPLHYCKLWPVHDYSNAPSFGVWQLLTSGFMHGGNSHLFFNMFALWMFGGALEKRMGRKRFAWYYFICLLGASLVQLVVATLAVKNGYPYATVGASGAVFGLLLAFGWLFPERKLMLIFLPIPIPARIFVALYGAAELMMGLSGAKTGIAHFAHLGGMVFGVILMIWWYGRGRDKRLKKF